MDTAAPDAGNWIPTEMSREVERLVSINLRVVSFLRRFNMPRSPFQFPRQAGRTTFTRRATEESVYPGGVRTEEVTDAAGTTTLFENVQFTAEELHGIVGISRWAEEDSIVALVPWFREEMSVSLARHLEDATLNGDDAGTHQDSDVTAATDHRASWDGMRLFGLANTTSRVDALGNTLNTSVEWGAQVRGVIAGMGGHGANPGNLVHVVGPRVFNKIVMIPEYRTLNTFGASASNRNVNANVAFTPDGHSLVVSEFAREDLNASGVHDAITTNLATSLIFDRRAWVLGQVRGMTIEVFTDSFMRIYGQTGIMLTWRGDLQAVQDPTAASQQHTAIAFDTATV